MRILGIDFTSAPNRKKPITCARCVFDGQTLVFEELLRWDSFTGFERALSAPGPWVTGIDFPFGQSRRLIENIGWPRGWSGYVRTVGALSRSGFRKALEDYKAPRPPGDKQHKRVCDKIADSQSPQTLYGTPVALMFYEGAPRLLRSGVHLPHTHDGDTNRIVLEAYPGIAARGVIGKRLYKNDAKKKQTVEKLEARRELLGRLIGGGCEKTYEFGLEAPMALADDPGADELDALLCAIQATWGWSRRPSGFGAPKGYDRLEGWICDPALA